MLDEVVAYEGGGVKARSRNLSSSSQGERVHAQPAGGPWPISPGQFIRLSMLLRSPPMPPVCLPNHCQRYHGDDEGRVQATDAGRS